MFGHGDLLIVDRIIGMQSDVATETITSLLLKIGHCDDQFAAVEQITVHLAGGTLVIADMSVIDDERAHFRPQIDVSILADGGHPSEIAADEILHFLCKLRHDIVPFDGWLAGGLQYWKAPDGYFDDTEALLPTCAVSPNEKCDYQYRKPSLLTHDSCPHFAHVFEKYRDKG